jgi:HK97 gp10 family phage protein
MAKVQIKLPTEFEERLSRLGEQTDAIIPKVLEAGGEVVLAKVKSNLSSVVGRGTKKESRSTGELERSLGLSPAKQKRDGSGWDVKIGFREPRSDGTSNAKIANVLEYGRHGQTPKPFLKPAKSASKNDCVTAMKSKFESEVDGI